MKRRNPRSAKHRAQRAAFSALNVSEWGKRARPAQVRAAAKMVVQRLGSTNRKAVAAA